MISRAPKARRREILAQGAWCVSRTMACQGMARPERLELPTLCFEGRCSIQLSYGREIGIILSSGCVVDEGTNDRGNSVVRFKPDRRAEHGLSNGDCVDLREGSGHAGAGGW